MTSALPVGNHQSQQFLGQRFYMAWQEGLFKGPFFETIPPYERGESLGQRFLRADISENDRLFGARFKPQYSWADVDHKFPWAKRLRDRIWHPGSDEADLEHSETNHAGLWQRRLFSHQWQAFEKITRSGRNVVVATGTGSGKTECFQLPILYSLLTEPAAVRAQRGIRALLIYPLNALVEDQIMRLRRLLFWLNLQYHAGRHESPQNHQITFGRYTGDTPVNSRDFSRKEPDEALSGLGEIIYREDMQSAPPDILITNFTMLEYMLLREDDRQLFGRPDLFKFIVLDEVHTYSGTQGMEVAMLLKRLRGFLRVRANTQVSIRNIGTSATLGGEHARAQGAEFASTLFGAAFEATDVVLGSKSEAEKAAWNASQWSSFLDLISDEPENASVAAILNGEHIEPSHPIWKQLADSLGVVLSTDHLAVSQSERLGALFASSGLSVQLRSLIEAHPDSCIDLDSLADLVSEQVAHPRTVVGKVLALISSGTWQHEPLVALRTHLFVNEARSAQICLFRECSPAIGGSDSWWRQLYIAHHESCDSCGSPVYSLLLCRRCGFVYLEGWCLQARLWSERDVAGKKDTYERWLFRPVDSGLPEVAKEVGVQRTLCLKCGRYFVGRNDPNFEQSQNGHACDSNRLLDIWVWRPKDLDGGQVESCLFCEQHWYSGEEVITKPAPSPYAVSTVLLEELKRQFDDSNSPTKIISFADTRQQAAQLALRLQGNNRDFCFRQMVYRISSEDGITTEDLLDELYDYVKHDMKLRFVMTGDPLRVRDNVLLREHLSTLLYRELVTAYLTLEAQGLVQVLYDKRLFEAAKLARPSGRLMNRLSDEEKESWFTFLLDWGMRFVRYAIGSNSWGGPALSFETLKEWNIYPKSAALFGSQEQAVIGFLVRQEKNRRNSVFNFASRLLRQGFGDRADLDIEEFHASVRPFWDSVLACSQLWARDAASAMNPLLNSGGLDPERCLIQLNFSSVTWQKAREEKPLFRCDTCGRLTFFSIKRVCPIRDCRGSLREISTAEIEENQFSPVRHYRRLVRTVSITPLRVEEHTAQISSAKRTLIERDFRSTTEDSIDVISGSTTFELGIDLGSIQSVFMSNLPPRAANYRQRAGRAGRRQGAQPFVLNYVRQRPHDQYFWNNPQSFIAGPLHVPQLSVSSEVVIFRHIAATIVGRLLELYRQQHDGRFGLTGPPARSFVDFALADLTDITIRKEFETKTQLSERLNYLLNGLPVQTTGAASWSQLRARFKALRETYLPLYAEDGCLDVLSDHGILPSYAFPIYVDELRLRQYPLREPPRSDLKLQRDRSIALREYSPGRVFIAGKYQVLSEGLWQGYEPKEFLFCQNCSTVDFRPSLSAVCMRCKMALVKKKAVLPRGGFFGRIVRSSQEASETDVAEATDVYFDPADDPPPKSHAIGRGMTIAQLDAREMLRSRMRMFNPRPSHDGLAMSVQQFSDAGLPHSPPARCLAKVTTADAERVHLMHEFTTDILEIRFSDNEIGRLLVSSQVLVEDLAHCDTSRREWLFDSVWLTLGTALSFSGAQQLGIDATEIAVIVRKTHEPGVLCGREIILYDTTAGGAGYARQLGDGIYSLFEAALSRLMNCECQDSCYACLRAYSNQLIHNRLHRKRALNGFSTFMRSNWSQQQGVQL
jgi:hypothetical protein